MDFGQYFKDLRREHKFTQRELAKRIGVCHTYISKIENGALPAPSREMLENVANVYHLETIRISIDSCKDYSKGCQNSHTRGRGIIKISYRDSFGRYYFN